MALRPPYPAIYQGMIKGKVIPFLGAGVPLYLRNPKDVPWAERKDGDLEVRHLPTATELACELKREAALEDSSEELTKMAQYYEGVLGLDPLRTRLCEIFSHKQEPTPIHRFLAQLPRPLLIITTNYDDLMERAFDELNKPYDVVTHLTDKTSVLWWCAAKRELKEVAGDELLVELDDVPVIYKMHGAIDRNGGLGGYVITENDYIEFLTRMTRKTVIPTIFAEPFEKRHFLFMGYGLGDWNLRVLLNSIQAFRGVQRVRSWAIETLPKPVEQKLWAPRGVDIYDQLTLADFLAELQKQGAPAAAGGGA